MSTSNQGGEDSFASLFEKGSSPQRQRRWAAGDEVEGVVVKIGSDAVFLDLDGKREAFIERISLVDGAGQPLDVSVGDTMVARVVEVGRHVGGVRLEPVSIRRPGAETGQDDEEGEQVELVDASGPRLATGAHVKGEIVRVEPYGVFVQIEGTTGKQGRGLVPAVETGFPRGTDLRKKLPIGTQLEVKVLNIADDGKIRLSIKALAVDEERASFEKFSGKAREKEGGAGFGTLATAFARSQQKPKKR